MPAGRVLVVLVVALAVGALFNSEAIVRAGEGMRDGPTRDVVLSLGRPLDDAAGAVALHLPREGFDLSSGRRRRRPAAPRSRAARPRSCVRAAVRPLSSASPLPSGRCGCS